RQWGGKPEIASSLGVLGDVALRQGDYSTGWALCQESLVIQRELGDKASIVRLLDGMGRAARSQGDQRAARALDAERLALCWEMEDKQGIAASIEALGSIAAAEEQTLRAARLFGAAGALLEAIGLPERSHSARAALNEDMFTAAWEAGRAMSLEEA